MRTCFLFIGVLCFWTVSLKAQHKVGFNLGTHHITESHQDYSPLNLTVGFSYERNITNHLSLRSGLNLLNFKGREGFVYSLIPYVDCNELFWQKVKSKQLIQLPIDVKLYPGRRADARVKAHFILGYAIGAFVGGGRKTFYDDETSYQTGLKEEGLLLPVHFGKFGMELSIALSERWFLSAETAIQVTAFSKRRFKHIGLASGELRIAYQLK